MALMHDELLAALPADVYQALDMAPGMPYKPSVKLQEQAPARLCCPERRGLPPRPPATGTAGL